MAKEVAFKPLSKVTPNLVEAPKKIDEPSYPDAGISYGGYSKKLFSGNTFQLSKQEQIDLNITTTFSAGATSMFTERPNIETKDFYCTCIIISGNNVGLVSSTATITIRDGVSGTTRVIFMEPVPSEQNWTKIFNFDIPLKFSKGKAIQVAYSSARTAGDFLAFNAYGWEEEPIN